MKNLSLLFLVVLVCSACSSSPEVSEDLGEGFGSDVMVSDDTVVEGEEDEVEDEFLPVAEVDEEEVVYSASSVLEDSTGIGFNYEAEMVMDKDFSTAWCVAADDEERFISVDFPESYEFGVVGIVPGFARDETIYFQNERISDLSVIVGAGKEAGRLDFQLDDEYGMQFIDLNGAIADSLQFMIDDTYEGSKYSDICIAEIDFTSEYVVNEDEVAALNYYETYKKDSALEPYDIVEKIVMSDRAPDACNEPQAISRGGDTYMFYHDETGEYAAYAGISIYGTAIINEYGEEGDSLDLKWYHQAVNFDAPEMDQPWELTGYMNGVKVVESCDGNLYLHFDTEDFPGVWGPSFGTFRVSIFNDGKIVARQNFHFTQ